MVVYNSMSVEVGAKKMDVMEVEGEQEKKSQQKMRALYAKMNIVHSRYYKLFPLAQGNKNVLDVLVTSFTHKRKNPNEKLVQMRFLKDNKTVILGYDKSCERGDINFLDLGEPKVSDFYYNKLSGGLGGLVCFQDGRMVLATDKKGVFSYIDMSKGPNIEDIRNSSIQTTLDGVTDISLSPSQTKLACGLANNKCIVVDVDRAKAARSTPLKKFDGHANAVSSVNWHPYRSLVLTSSAQAVDTVKLWDPLSERLVQETRFHGNNIVTKCLFHPQGNTYFSLSKDNSILECEIRYSRVLNKYKLQHEPTTMDIMSNGNVVAGDTNGTLSWFDSSGQLLGSEGATSGIVLLSVDASKTILLVAREKEHSFEIYTHKSGLSINTDF